MCSPDPNQEVKVIAKQAIGKCICNRVDIPGVKLQKIAVVLLFNKNIFSVVAPIVNMVKVSRLESG